MPAAFKNRPAGAGSIFYDESGSKRFQTGRRRRSRENGRISCDLAPMHPK
jgi:hypothetical protein